MLIFAVLQIRLIFVGTGKWNKGSALAAATEEGGIYINLDTISALGERAVRKVECVRELRIKTFMSKEGANICIKVSLEPEAIIPEASAAVQQSVKSDIEALCGIKVNKVLVQVDTSLQAQK